MLFCIYCPLALAHRKHQAVTYAEVCSNLSPDILLAAPHSSRAGRQSEPNPPCSKGAAQSPCAIKCPGITLTTEMTCSQKNKGALLFCPLEAAMHLCTFQPDLPEQTQGLFRVMQSFITCACMCKAVCWQQESSLPKC